MIYQHKTTGEKREFVQGMTIADEWSPVRTMKSGPGVMSLSEVDPKSISTNKSRKAAATRAKNKAAKQKADEQARIESEAKSVEDLNEEVTE